MDLDRTKNWALIGACITGAVAAVGATALMVVDLLDRPHRADIKPLRPARTPYGDLYAVTCDYKTGESRLTYKRPATEAEFEMSWAAARASGSDVFGVYTDEHDQPAYLIPGDDHWLADLTYAPVSVGHATYWTVRDTDPEFRLAHRRNEIDAHNERVFGPGFARRVAAYETAGQVSTPFVDALAQLEYLAGDQPGTVTS